MPKRILDDSFLTSPSLARCSPRAQDAFPRFILMCDDFGCFEVIPRALVARGWVYRGDVTPDDIATWLEEYLVAGMAVLWTLNERTYCYLTGWDGPHGQRKRHEYDPDAPRGTPAHHGSKRKTPRPPPDLVAAVLAGARLDRGEPPGRGAIPPGNAPGTEPNDSAPAREVEVSRIVPANSRHFPPVPAISAAAVAVAVAVPVPFAVAGAVGRAEDGQGLSGWEKRRSDEEAMRLITGGTP